jgi:hypothetical protein
MKPRVKFLKTWGATFRGERFQVAIGKLKRWDLNSSRHSHLSLKNLPSACACPNSPDSHFDISAIRQTHVIAAKANFSDSLISIARQ